MNASPWTRFPSWVRRNWPRQFSPPRGFLGPGCWFWLARSWVERSSSRCGSVRERGLLVVSLNMAGSVPEAADLVVTDPIQAGVMAVMAISDTARFRVDKLKKTVY